MASSMQFPSVASFFPGFNYGCQVPTAKGLYAQPSPTLNIIPEDAMNISNRYTRFLIQAENMPEDVHLHSFMLEAIVETPSGKTIPCRIAVLVYSNGLVEPNWFTGNFQAEGDIGNYTVRVRLSLPLTMWKTGSYGIISKEATLLFVRNYFKASLDETATSFQVDFEPWTPERVGRKWKEATSSPSKAWGLTCDKFTDRLYYTDRNGDFLSCVDPEGRVIFTFRDKIMNPSLNHPTGICVDYANRRLVVADKDNHKVRFFSMEGQYISSFGEQGHINGKMSFPWDVAVSPSGDKIAVTDSRNKRVQFFDQNGKFINKFTVFESSPFFYKSRFDYPRGVTFNREGTYIYVTDFNVHNIMEIPVSCQTFRKLLPDGGSGSIFRPQGITMDSDGCLLACDSQHGSIRQVCPESGYTLSQVYAIGKLVLHSPQNVATMRDGRLAVLEANGLLRIF